MILALLAAAVLVRGHPDSLSQSRIQVTGSRAVVELRFQALSLLDERPELDRDGNRLLDVQEAEQARQDIQSYLLDAFRLVRSEGEREERLAGRLEALTPQEPSALGALELQNLDARLVFDAPAALGVFAIEMRLFQQTNPWHKDYCTVSWNTEEPVRHVFEGGEPRWLFEPGGVRRPGVFAVFVKLGVDHIRTGFDHQAFLLALLVASRRVRTLLGVVTAFTLAHSITLALAAVGWVDVPSRFVELAIALSIAYVACDTLLRKDARNPWLEAFFFGLLHGLGFAGFLKEQLTGEPLLLTALVGFNVGVELGQLALVSLCLLVLALLFRAHRERVKDGTTVGIVPPFARNFVSLLVALCGFYWFVERAGWLPWG